MLAELAARVCTVERIPRLAARARQTLEALGVQQRVGADGATARSGWPDEAPFDRILVAAGGPAVPPPLFEQLAEGGRMVMPVGRRRAARCCKVDREGRTARCASSEDSACVFVKLVGKYAWEA